MSTTYEQQVATTKAEIAAALEAHIAWENALADAIQAELDNLPDDMPDEDFAAWKQSFFERYVAPLNPTLHELRNALNEAAELDSSEPLHRFVAELGKRTDALRALRQPTPTDR